MAPRVALDRSLFAGRAPKPPRVRPARTRGDRAGTPVWTLRARSREAADKNAGQ
ncbi:hypothetical protein GLE_0792 [Lysobacter enzymogenes]|uniref:Uncharacterized protein n=1 Tax=Lysobacter enzymogenes TaxID=69 RepID=A0A0S2DCB5_LYSEN|nr:hypothetical protein GLE_0792 [Lysobacter enzymogenes]